MSESPVSTAVDYERDGVQHGHLSLPHSRDSSAWGSLMIPITVVRNGDGPTVVLTGANHGDEYEGPIALYDLAANLRADQITGRVIILPAMNYPAFRAGSRTSPIDGGNMNRIFPGRPDGTLTEKVADYIQRTLIPMADVVLDFHSGGKTLEFVPFACSHELEDKSLQARCAAARDAFNAPWSLTLLELDNVGMYDTAVEEAGKVFVSTELGGGGSSTAETVAIAKKGVRNLLKHAGVLEGALEMGPTTVLDMPDGDCFVACEDDGLIEPRVDLGQQVEKGEVVALVHEVRRTGQTPVEYRAKRAGVLAGRHFPGLISMGDPIAMIAVPV